MNGLEALKVATVEDYLNNVSYEIDPKYVPSDFALEFVNFMKLVDGGENENKTPVMHYHMLDNFIAVDGGDTINMCHRGAAKSTLKEYLILYLGTFASLPGFGKVPYGLYVSDSMDNGVKKMRKALEYRYNNSEFLKKYVPTIRFTDTRWEFINLDGVSTVFSGHGAKALSLDSKLYTEYGTTTIGSCSVGDRIYGADGELACITRKSEVFHKAMYSLNLRDGRSLKVSEDHINSVTLKNKNSGKITKANIPTKELLELPLQHIRNRRTRITKENLVFVENCAPINFPIENLPIDPYTLGVILGDARIRKDCGSVELTGHIDDFPHYIKEVPYTFGKYQIDKRNSNVRTQSIRGLGRTLVMLKLNVHGDFKFIPEMYLRGSVKQRLALLQGLMDTDGTVSKRKINSVASFCTNSVELAEGVRELVYSLGGWVHFGRTGDTAYRLQIHLNMQIFRLKRKACIHQLNSREYVPVVSIVRIPDEPSQCIAINNEDRQFIADMFFRTHNTGVRGTRENGSRPVMALLDDLISDADARSPTVIADVEDTIYKAIDYALHPKKRKIIWSGTPFNAKDPLYKAVESGAWKVNVYPVCERYPCTEAEFRGSWEDRFDYAYVKRQYDKAFMSGKAETFMQELMLRIMSEEDRLIKNCDISWYQRKSVLDNKHLFNFYITTDFATSEKTSADFSVISVWAYDANGRWYWVDGICKKQLMDKNVDDLFRLAQMYNPQQVGVEITGQQKGFIAWIRNEMITRNCHFTLASEGNRGDPGIRPNTDKMTRFNTILPMFKLNMVLFPEERRTSEEIVECMDELTLITKGGFKSKHDDFLDTISMLTSLTPWKPANIQNMSVDDNGMWGMEDEEDSFSDGYNSYVV